MSSVDSLFYFEGAEGTTRLTQQEADEIESGDRSGNCSGTISGHGNRRTKSNTVVAVCCGNTRSRRTCRCQTTTRTRTRDTRIASPNRIPYRPPFVWKNESQSSWTKENAILLQQRLSQSFSSSTASSLTRSGDGTKQKRKVFVGPCPNPVLINPSLPSITIRNCIECTGPDRKC